VIEVKIEDVLPVAVVEEKKEEPVQMVSQEE